MDPESTTTGGCLCGDLRYQGRGEPTWVAHCHCRWCQRYSGAAFLTCVGFAIEDLECSSGKLAIYESSSEVERGFCPRCGSTLTCSRLSRNETGVLAGSLDNPHGIRPTAHMFFVHCFAWPEIKDELPRYERFSPRDAGLG